MTCTLPLVEVALLSVSEITHLTAITLIPLSACSLKVLTLIEGLFSLQQFFSSKCNALLLTAFKKTKKPELIT